MFFFFSPSEGHATTRASRTYLLVAQANSRLNNGKWYFYFFDHLSYLSRYFENVSTEYTTTAPYGLAYTFVGPPTL